jgi:three-Cys-motif partner protein
MNRSALPLLGSPRSRVNQSHHASGKHRSPWCDRADEQACPYSTSDSRPASLTAAYTLPRKLKSSKRSPAYSREERLAGSRHSREFRTRVPTNASARILHPSDAPQPAANLMSEPVDDWTFQRLAVLKRYLCAFTTAAKDRALSTAYIDAFAGADYCADHVADSDRLAGFPTLADAPPKSLLKCSARTAVTTEPAFDGYVFIERNVRRCRVLDALGHEFRHRNIQVRRIDANRELRRISHLNWSTRRAVLFVDAYAANLEWDTIAAVAGTNAIDTWLLFPVGFAPRPSAKASALPPHWRDRLNRLFQTDEWFIDFDASKHHVDGQMEVLSRYFTVRLKAAFANVSHPRVLRSVSGAPLYLLCFASAAPGIDGRAAVELADHLLEIADS